MKTKHQRIILVISGLISVIVALILILPNFKDNIVFFYSPSDLLALDAIPEKKIRIGGLVKEGSYIKDGNNMEFIITDNQKEIKVTYQGIPPNLFREGQGMVANGYMKEDIFIAEQLLAKHDENYMPKEVYDSLKDKYEVQEES